MPPKVLKIFLLVVFFASSLNAGAQVCTGSLGDPVINETFGAGATYGTVGPALPTTITNYNYTSTMCPGDGFYTITSALGTCFSGTWQTVSHDHTGDANGYMMVINASYDPGVFYVQKASGAALCPNTTYEFAAWIMNLIRDMPSTSEDIRPNITFSIETVSGTVLKTYNTGDIPQVDIASFHQYGTFFTTPSNGEDIVVKMINNAPGGNGNDLILDDITFRPCGPVIETGFGSIGTTGDRDLCEGESGSYILRASQTGYDDPYYQWQTNNNDGKGWVDISGANTTTLTRNFVNAVPGKYQYRIGVLNGPSAALQCRIYSQPLNINVNPLPVVKINKETIVCEGQELRLTATGGDTYSWSGPNNFTSDEQSPVISYDADNSKDGVYTVTAASKGCTSTGSTTVSVLPKVQASISSNVTICRGEATQLLAGGGRYYKWEPSTGLNRDDIPDPVAQPTQTTVYHVVVDNGGCIDGTKMVTVTVLQPPIANAGEDVKIQEGEAVRLKGTIGGDSIRYYWTPSETLSDPLSLTPLAQPTNNTTYTLHVESDGGCGIATDSIFVRVYKKITVPNTFSPNGDGVNDYWNIDQLSTYPECLLTIYSRDGQEVYKSYGYAKPWTGNYQGKALPAGVYYYVIDLKNNTPKRTGWVLLVR
ncbi:gliding motility-associated C-terminal domain-containing protein [Mucilaginibacter segetis]|uniref:Gliding motility-associated C-terminal domain-containing protein n=1 Tax=Mucilaginibacter segetis TaxID=2793071 RepID=A0A934PN80_9SPHI|nr:gliding motility-associated C-terminal domain-containing protein [Mucilaginibacter segetis]MBK0377673.1 gliding motility-associated C-terminal domain-containing protein [Mucilaginibacter segetis]